MNDGMLPPEMMGGTFTGSSFMNRGLEPTAIAYRLDTEKMLNQIELYLRSSKIVGREVDGEYVEEMVQVARPLANEDGVQALMGWLKMTIGPHNVQGNLREEYYHELIYEIHLYLAENLMAQRVNWGIRQEDYNMIIDQIMTTMQLFLSRTIDNQERLSYGQSMLTKEMNVVNGPEKKGILGKLFS